MSLPNENSTSYITTHDFPGGQIQVAVVKMENGMVVHAYRPYRAHGGDQWYAPVKTAPAEAATKLAYGRDAFAGRQKTAEEVWNNMLPYLEPIPQL